MIHQMLKIRPFFKVELVSFVFATSLLSFCSSRQIHYSDPVEMLYDNYWVNENTLQIQIEYNSTENIPYTLRKESSCRKAKEMIDTRLYTLYPSLKTIRHDVSIYKTLYHKKQDCRLIVHVYLPDQKNKPIKSEVK